MHIELRPAEADTGVLLLRNTEWTRALYSRIRSMLDSRSTVDKVAPRSLDLMLACHSAAVKEHQVCSIAYQSRQCIPCMQMIAGLAHYHEEYGGRNDRTALVWLVYKDPEEYTPQVRHVYIRPTVNIADSKAASERWVMSTRDCNFIILTRCLHSLVARYSEP